MGPQLRQRAFPGPGTMPRVQDGVENKVNMSDSLMSRGVDRYELMIKLRVPYFFSGHSEFIAIVLV